jgi:SH3 domain protein
MPSIVSDAKPIFLALIVSFILSLAVAEPASAQTSYVTDVLHISIRNSVAEDATVIKYLRSGTAMEVLEKSDQFARVRVSDGTEGWVSKRYLTKTPPNYQRIAELEKELAKYKSVSAKATASKEELSRLKKELKAAKTQIKALKAQSGGSDELLAENDALKAENEVLKRQTGIFGQTLLFFKNKDVLIWFISGAGVLLVGWLIGRSARSRRY